MDSIAAWLNMSALPDIMQVIIALASSVLAFLIARGLLARGVVYLAKRTKNQVDDMLVKYMRPYRFAWIAPFLVLYAFTSLLPEGATLIRHILLFFILWISLITFNALLDAINAIYEASKLYNRRVHSGLPGFSQAFSHHCWTHPDRLPFYGAISCGLAERCGRDDGAYAC